MKTQMKFTIRGRRLTVGPTTERLNGSDTKKQCSIIRIS